jgi:tellurite methyltransferase
LIDIGCGDGRDTHFFSKNKIFSKGVDFSQETIKQNKPLSNKYLSFEHMDLESINELNETFEYAYCRFIFHSITENIESKLLLIGFHVILKRIYLLKQEF